MSLRASVDREIGVEQEQRTRFRPDIQGLRAVAVLMVIAAHAGVPGAYGGFAGVDVFFVISGFLITGLLVHEARRDGRISLPQFYARRARRILPAGTIVLLITVGLGLPLLGEVRTEGIVEDSLWAAFFAVNWKFGFDGTDYFASALPPSPLQHYWSLAVEEQFYLVWPALLIVGLVALRRRGGGELRSATWTAVVVLGAVIIFVTSLTWSVVSTDSEPTMAYFSSLTRAWELALGALVALLAPRLARLSDVVRAALGWGGLVAIASSVAVLDHRTPFPGYAALLPVVGAALTIIGGIGRPRAGAGLLLELGPMRWVGDRSYSLYLWHWPWLIVGAAYFGWEDASLAQNALLVGAALLCSMLSYTIVEVPFHKGWPRVPNLRFLVLWPLSFALLLVAAGVVQLRTADDASSEPAGFATPGAATEQAGPETGDDVTAAVAEAAAAAAAGEGIPDQLSPSPAGARDDTWHADGSCGVADQGTTTSQGCVIGDETAERSIVVIGDSHAGMWLPSVDRIGEEQGMAVHPMVKYGCTAADVIPWRADLGGAQTDCTLWREWAFDQVTALRPDLVIMSSRTPPSLATADGEPMDGDEEVAAHEAGVGAAIERLRAVSGRVVVFADTPTSEFDPVTCVDQPGNDLGDCAFTPSDEVRVANVGIEAAATATGGEFLDLTGWFCADELCPSVVAEMLVYFDPGHITRTYGLALAPHLGRVLDLERQ